MRNKKQSEPFYEAMPGTMDQGMMHGDRSMLRNIMPWLLLPAAILLAKGLWNMTSDKPAVQNMRNKVKEMPDKLKNSAQHMMKRDENTPGNQNQSQ
jgi:hypothetical protein